VNYSFLFCAIVAYAFTANFRGKVSAVATQAVKNDLFQVFSLLFELLVAGPS